MFLYEEFEKIPASKRAVSYRKTICGVGINDADFTASIFNGKKSVNHPVYDIWYAMIFRCYHGVAKHPTYAGVVVCEDWLYFSNYFKWYKDNYVDCWHVDKDLLTDAKEYSPETCIFVPRVLNNFLTDSAAARGNLPIGLTYRKTNGKIRCRVNNPITGVRENLGDFIDLDEAIKARTLRKLEIAEELKPLMDSIDGRICPRAVSVINSQR